MPWAAIKTDSDNAHKLPIRENAHGSERTPAPRLYFSKCVPAVKALMGRRRIGICIGVRIGILLDSVLEKVAGSVLDFFFESLLESLL